MSIIVRNNTIKFLNTITAKAKNETLRIELHGDEVPHIIKVTHDGYTITASLLAGKFPNYKGFFPETYTVRTTTRRKTFEEILKSAAEATEHDNNNIRIKSDDNSVITYSDNEAAKFKIITEATTENIPHNEIPKTTIGINAKYAYEAIKNFKTKSIYFEYKNPLSPIIVSSEEDPATRALIMPLKI